MRVEEIAVRQEVRQMLNEAGVNRNTLNDMVRDVLHEEVGKAVEQVLHETNTEGAVSNKIKQYIDKSVERIMREVIRNRVSNVFDRMKISVDITDKEGQSIITK